MPRGCGHADHFEFQIADPGDAPDGIDTGKQAAGDRRTDNRHALLRAVVIVVEQAAGAARGCCGCEALPPSCRSIPSRD